MLIKPHHFLDIIKLYGAGIYPFVPDTTLHHDFYKIANQLIEEPQTKLKLTLDADAICEPCIKLKAGICDDPLVKFKGFTLKDKYNKEIDRRMFKLYGINSQQVYTAQELCDILYQNRDYIFSIWLEEDLVATKKRYDLFCLGAKKVLGI